MKAMLLAAGRGERMGPLSADVPKPLLRIGGVPLIERHVARLAASGITEIVINLSYRGAQIRDHLGDGRRLGVSLAYSDEGEPPLETLGGIVQALPLLGHEPFLLVNSDTYTDFAFATLTAGAREPTLVLVPNPAHNERGDFGVDAAGRVAATAPLMTYAGIAVFDPRALAALERGRRPLKPWLDAAVAKRELRAVVFNGLWLDVGTPERLAAARRIAET
jgi:N-acetyl-alpha-D-muramate 1-phosphate uridylyltransferase